MIVITGTNRLQHFLFDAYVDQKHLYHEALIAFIKSNLKLKDEKKFFMFSDHGFTQIKTKVCINKWLYENGYLKFNTDKLQMVSDIRLRQLLLLLILYVFI